MRPARMSAVCKNLQKGRKTDPLFAWKTFKYFWGHSLFKCEKKSNKDRNKKEVPSKLCKVLWQVATGPSLKWKAWRHQNLLENSLQNRLKEIDRSFMLLGFVPSPSIGSLVCSLSSINPIRDFQLGFIHNWVINRLPLDGDMCGCCCRFILATLGRASPTTLRQCFTLY